MSAQHFLSKGLGEYLEGLVARIDAPQLNKLHVTLFNQIAFETPQFLQFISRTPMLKPPKKAVLFLTRNTAARVKRQTLITDSY